VTTGACMRLRDLASAEVSFADRWISTQTGPLMTPCSGLRHDQFCLFVANAAREEAFSPARQSVGEAKYLS
jgi:hypothetical protein